MVTVVAGLWLGWAGLTRIRDKGFPRLPLGGAWSLAVVGGIVVIAGLTLPRQFMRPNVATPTPSGARPASTATLAIDEPPSGQVVPSTDAQLDVVMTLDGGHHRRHRQHDAHAGHRTHPPVARRHPRLHDVRARAARRHPGPRPGRAHARGGVRRRRPRAVRSTRDRTGDVHDRGWSMRRIGRPSLALGIACVIALGLAGPAAAHANLAALRSGGERAPRPGTRRGHHDVLRAARPVAVDRARPGRERRTGRGGTGRGRARARRPAADRAPREPARRRLHGELARGLRGGRARDRGRVQLRGQRGAGHGRHAERPRADDAIAVRGQRRRQAPAVRGARAVVRRRRRRVCSRSGAGSPSGSVCCGSRRRRPWSASSTMLLSERATLGVSMGDLLSSATGTDYLWLLGGVTFAAVVGARRGAEVRPDLARRCRGRRGGGHAHPCHRRSRRRRGDPGAPDRPAMAPLHGRERVDGGPRADVPLAPGATPNRGKRPGRRGPGVLVPGRLRAGRRARHRRAPRDAGGRRPVEAVRSVPRLVRDDARRQGRASSWS